jgi:hypothetical protein
MHPWILEQLAAENRSQYLARAERWRARRPPRPVAAKASMTSDMMSRITRILPRRHGHRPVGATVRRAPAA